MVARTLAAVLLLAVAACGDGATKGSDPTCEATLRVTSFNIRFGEAEGSEAVLDENGWLYEDGPRRDRVIDVARALDADILGVQEALANQVDDLTAALPEYSFVGVGRDDGIARGEYAGVFYRSARFSEVASGHFWLSLTPEVPGTVFEGSNNIRMATWVHLRDQSSAREVVVLNTHWDHVSAPSREQSAALIRERLATIAGDGAVVLTGDLNVPPGDAAFAILLSDAPADTPQLIDGYRQAHPVAGEDEGTVHFFTGATNVLRIDYVLHTDHLETVAAEIDHTSFDGLYPSDHFPVTNTLRWASCEAG